MPDPMILRKDPLTKEEWLRLIGHSAHLLQLEMERITFMMLGQLPCQGYFLDRPDSKWEKPLSAVCPEIIKGDGLEDADALRFPGIFWLCTEDRGLAPWENGDDNFIGLTRSHGWIKGFLTVEQHNFGAYSRHVVRLTIQKCTLDEVVELESGHHIYNELSRAANWCLERQEAKFIRLKGFLQDMDDNLAALRDMQRTR